MTPGRVAATLKLVEFASLYFGVSEETIMAFVEEHKTGGKRVAPPAPDFSRWQDVVLEQEVPEGASILDLGCGRGNLLSRLMETRHVSGQGVELDPEAVVSCIARGVPVIQSDLDAGLRGFPCGSF
ncbi:MAG: methionine biosynthesis protein MetW, partial [Synergistota bacterium]|nr:methionine biosynthesis protein MetW [Synergistota bacterium]